MWESCLGDWEMVVKSGKSTIYGSPAISASTNLPVPCSFCHLEKKEWQMLSASTLILRSARREMCIFSLDPRFGHIDYHGIMFPVAE
jgi:hypothetical protein